MSPASDPNQVLGRLEGETRRIRLGLDRMAPLLESFGAPHKAYPAVLVAGTNGKGSTSTLLAAMASAAGYRTGLFTSPHLEGVEERLRLDGLTIPRIDLALLLEEIVGVASDNGLELPTYFEAMTLAAFVWFARSKVDLAILEVGMGGRLDATNVADPILSLVTEIGMDHQEQLGDTLAAIAVEKAGILRPRVAAVTSASEPEAVEALRARALEVSAPLVRTQERVAEIDVEEMEVGQTQLVRLCTSTGRYRLPLRLSGEHQVDNLVLAVLAAEELARQGFARLEPAAIERGAGACRWPGRLERVVLESGKEIWLDGAHNTQGAKALAAFLESRLADYDLVLGIKRDKNAAEIIETLGAKAHGLALTRVPFDNSTDPEGLAQFARFGSGSPQVRILHDPADALANSIAGERPLVVAGSLYLVGFARRWLTAEFGRPRPVPEVFAEVAARLARSV